MKTAAVVGLGLIGGSVARELAARGVRVLGADHDPAMVRAALRDRGIHAALGPGYEGAEAAEAAILAVPVGAAPDVLAVLVPRLDSASLVMDTGSTKRSTVAAAEALGIGDRFVGAHPLAGDHRSGWDASRLGLFRNARVFLCPTEQSTGEALALARELWAGLGGRLQVVDAAEHDRRLAWTSHLPQATSTALALALGSADVTRDVLGPGGRDVTRLAGSSPGIWTDIARDNAGPLGEALAALEERIGELRQALATGDEEAVRSFFAAGEHWSRGDEPGIGART